MAAFGVAGGSVAGRAHLAVGRGNQDAWAVAAAGEALALVVADGCGATPHSEVGAQLGARLAAAAILRRLAAGDGAASAPLRDAVHAELRAALGALARAMGPRLERTVEDCFLFTLVCAAVTPAETALFALGDGLLVVDGAARRLGPFPGNEPPYLGYALLEDGPPPPRLRLQLCHAAPTAEVAALLLGTDGAAELAAAEPIDELWRDPRYLANPDLVRRRLTIWRRDGAGRPGVVSDDTTVLVARRAAPAGEA